MIESVILVNNLTPVEHLYIHVPFCKRFCTYCSFPKEIYQETLFKSFLRSLKSELNHFAPLIKKVKTIYLGGGTPNACTINELDDLLKLIDQSISQSNLEEYSIECNPDSWNQDHLSIFKKYGITRISLGIQTTNEKINISCNRLQTTKMITNALRDLKKDGSFIISLDFILNLFNQKKHDIIQDLQFIKKYNPHHISWYSLMLKKGSPLYKTTKYLPENDFKYSLIVAKNLKKLGYEHYEICNYAKNHHYAKHNMSYWLSKNFLGLGWGAASLLYDKVKNQHFRRTIINSFASPKEKIQYLNDETFYFQILLMGLRLKQGININKSPFKEAYHFYFDLIKKEINHNYLKIKNEHLICTKHGFNFLDDILIRFLK